MFALVLMAVFVGVCSLWFGILVFFDLVCVCFLGCCGAVCFVFCGLVIALICYLVFGVRFDFMRFGVLECLCGGLLLVLCVSLL